MGSPKTLPDLGQGASQGCGWCRSASKRGFCRAQGSKILSCGCWVTSSLVSEELWKGLCNPGRNRGRRGHGSWFPFLQTSWSLAQLETRHVPQLAKPEELSSGYVYFFRAQRCRNWEAFCQQTMEAAFKSSCQSHCWSPAPSRAAPSPLCSPRGAPAELGLRGWKALAKIRVGKGRFGSSARALRQNYDRPELWRSPEAGCGWPRWAAPNQKEMPPAAGVSAAEWLSSVARGIVLGQFAVCLAAES